MSIVPSLFSLFFYFSHSFLFVLLSFFSVPLLPNSPYPFTDAPIHHTSQRRELPGAGLWPPLSASSSPVDGLPGLQLSPTAGSISSRLSAHRGPAARSSLCHVVVDLTRRPWRRPGSIFATLQSSSLASHEGDTGRSLPRHLQLHRCPSAGLQVCR
jgi:hypothetical protein